MKTALKLAVFATFQAVLDTLRRKMIKVFGKYFQCLILVLFTIVSCAELKHIPNTNYRIYHKDSLVVHTELVGVPIPRERESAITTE